MGERRDRPISRHPSDSILFRAARNHLTRPKRRAARRSQQPICTTTEVLATLTALMVATSACGTTRHIAPTSKPMQRVGFQFNDSPAVLFANAPALLAALHRAVTASWTFDAALAIDQAFRNSSKRSPYLAPERFIITRSKWGESLSVTVQEMMIPPVVIGTP